MLLTRVKIELIYNSDEKDREIFIETTNCSTAQDLLTEFILVFKSLGVLDSDIIALFKSRIPREVEQISDKPMLAIDDD